MVRPCRVKNKRNLIEIIKFSQTKKVINITTHYDWLTLTPIPKQ